MTARAILHVDMDAFYASVEQRDDPALRGRPVLVGGSSARGVVCAASYEARKFGCRSAMPMGEARRLCPAAVVIRPRFEAYKEASDRVFEVFEGCTPLVEPLSLDEAFLDVTGSRRLLGDGETIARLIRARVRGAVNLTCSVGVAHNKFLAKLASDMNKPDGLTRVPSGGEELLGWLGRLPVGRMWGIGPKGEARLHGMGLRTFGDLQARTRAELEGMLGAWGARCYELCRGMDERPVVPDRGAKSIGHEETFERDIGDVEELRSILMHHVEVVSRRLRRGGRRGKGVSLKLRHGDFRTFSRSRTLEAYTDSTDVLWMAADELLRAFAASADFAPLRLLGMSVENLEGEPGSQMELFGAGPAPRGAGLDRATDEIARRFGADAIRRARGMKKE